MTFAYPVAHNHLRPLELSNCPLSSWRNTLQNPQTERRSRSHAQSLRCSLAGIRGPSRSQSSRLSRTLKVSYQDDIRNLFLTSCDLVFDPRAFLNKTSPIVRV